MRLVSYNILNGGVGRADPVAEVIVAQAPDVVALVEADDDWVVQRIAKRLGFDGVVGDGQDHRVAVLSRWPVKRSVRHSAFDQAGPRCLVEVELDTPGGPLVVFALHLSPKATLEAEAERVRQLRRLLRITEPLRTDARPHVLAGDFNANAPGQRIDLARCKPATQKYAAENGGTIPRDAIAVLLDAGYADTLAKVRHDAAFDLATFTTHAPGQRVDYIFAHGVSPVDAWVETDRLATFASDHYPVGVELQWPAKAVP